MTIRDAVIVCAQVLKMEPVAIAMAYDMPIVEVNAIIKADGKRRTGKFPVVVASRERPMANGAVENGVNRGIHTKVMP